MGAIDLLAAFAAVCSPLVEPGGECSEHAGEDSVVEIVCHGFPQALAAGLTEQAEYARGVVAQTLANHPCGAERGLAVHVYVDAEEFEEQTWRLADDGELLRRDPENGCAHLLMDPRLPGETLAAHGVPWETARRVAEEAARLSILLRCESAQPPPAWLLDGLAAWAGEQAAARVRPAYELEHDPRSGWGLAWLCRAEERKELRNLDDVIAGIEPEWSESRLAVLRHNVFRFLMQDEQHETGLRFVETAMRLSCEGSPQRFEKELGGMLKRRGWKQLESQFQAYCAELRPRWRSGSGVLDMDGPRWFHAAPADSADYSWRLDELTEKEYRLEGSLQTLPGSEGDLGVLLMDDGLTFFLVALSAEDQRVSVFEYHEGGRKWDTLGSAELPAPAAEDRIEFALAARPRHLVVAVAGEELLDLSIRRRKPHGQWGLYAARGSAGVWHDLVVR